jgi:hypothetical protein
MTDRFRNADFQVGVYGSGHVCRLLRRNKVAEFFWLPKSPGWAGTRDYYASGQWSLFQNIHEYPVANTGVKADFNIVSPNVTNLGEWSKQGVGKTHSQSESQNVFDAYRFPKSNPLIFRFEPSINAREMYRLNYSTTKSVKIIEKKQDWVRIYFGDEDAINGNFTTATGWCRESDLSPDYLAMTY